jgi:hypothetical protein
LEEGREAERQAGVCMAEEEGKWMDEGGLREVGQKKKKKERKERYKPTTRRRRRQL